MKLCPISTHVSRLSLGIITTMMTRNMTTAFMVTPKSTPSLSYFHKPLDHLHLPIRSSTIITPTLLFSTPPTKRVPRRNLKKVCHYKISFYCIYSKAHSLHLIQFFPTSHVIIFLNTLIHHNLSKTNQKIKNKIDDKKRVIKNLYWLSKKFKGFPPSNAF